MTDLQHTEPLSACDVVDPLRQQLAAARAEITRLTAELEQHRRRQAMAQEMLRRAGRIVAERERGAARLH
jgi:uncharacterized small protein (DUF1192 family)